jgi:formylglycine-generating enzyme
MSDWIAIDAMSYAMGSEAFYPEEGPVHEVSVDAFLLARAPVTNAEFAAFVAATGWVTVAERPLDPADFEVRLESTQPGSLVFTPTSGPVDLDDWRHWWRWVPGASWRRPFGPGSDLSRKDDHPVVQVCHADADAYAAWAGARLPSEVEWEAAARGGLSGATYAWGEQPHGQPELRANTWQGRFPYDNRGALGFAGTSPVGTFAPNSFGLVDMIGNVWEWTSSPWTDRHRPSVEVEASSCACSPSAAPAPGRLVLKGGSHLCSPDYCLRYRPAARSPQDPHSATTHIGFRLARSA